LASICVGQTIESSGVGAGDGESPQAVLNNKSSAAIVFSRTRRAEVPRTSNVESVI